MSAERSQSTELVLDLGGTLSRFGGDRELFRDMVGFFFEDAPALCDELQTAVETADALLVRKKAHALKGLIASCGGARAAHAAQRLEFAGETNDIEAMEPLFATLRDEFERLKFALLPYLA